MAYVVLNKLTGELAKPKTNGTIGFQSRRHAKQWARTRRIRMAQNEIIFMTSKEMERFA